MKVVIIEDEVLSQEELERILRKNFSQIEIVAKLDSVTESIDWLSHNNSDLIFMDIQLSDGISFDIFKHITIKTPVIFTTAFDQYAIQAFKVNGIGYLLKPVIEEDLIQAVNKFKNTYDNISGINQLMEYISPSKKYKNRITVKTGDSITFINMSDIAYFYSEDRVTFSVTKHGRKHIVDYTIESLEQLLDPDCFFRLTRGCIASIESIHGVYKYFNSRLKITLKPEYHDSILISRTRVPEFLKWMDGA